MSSGTHVYLLVVALLCLTRVHTAPLTVTADTIIVVPTEDQTDPAFKLALRDVSQDWYSRLGLPPVVLNQFPLPQSNAFNVLSDFVVLFGSNDALKKEFPVIYNQLNLGPQSEEQHYCKALPFDSSLQTRILVCGGSERLGSIYALYEFSHSILNIDPQRFWVEKNTQTLHNITVDPTHSFDSGAPFFLNRGFFINDEDQLGGWAMDPIGQKVFTLQMWDMVYQTILRLKGNAVIVGTAAYPDEQSFDLAARRGLSIAEHHITLLGVNIFAWPDGLPYDYPYNPELIEYVWKSVATYQASQNRSTLWTVGYRGKNDYAFWRDVPSFNTSASRGKLIGDAMQTQKEILETVESKPKMFTYLWDEMLPLYTGGYLKVPEGVSIVHADNGAGQIFNEDTVAAGHGLYYHVAMEDGSQNQLTELCSPARLFEQLAMFVKKKANSYFILNTSDIRAVPLSTQAAMEFVWNPSPFLAQSPSDAQNAYIQRWVARVYNIQNNSQLVKQIAQLYNLYFGVDYMAGLHGAVPLGEQYLNSQIRSLIDAIFDWGMKGRTGSLPVAQAKELIRFAQNPTKQLASLSAQALVLLPQIPVERQQFYRSHLLFQTNLHLHAINALTDAANAIIVLTNGTANSTGSALYYLDHSSAEIDSLIKAEHSAEAGVWEYWFMWDQLDDWFSVHDRIRNASLALIGVKENELPTGRWWRGGTGIWSQEFQYEFAQKTYFPLFYPSEYYFDTAAKVLCSSSNCKLSAIGLDFSGSSASIVMTTERRGLIVRYTLDGSVPTASSPQAKGPIEITAEWVKKYENAAVSAISFTSAGEPAGPVTRAIIRLSK